MFITILIKIFQNLIRVHDGFFPLSRVYTLLKFGEFCSQSHDPSHRSTGGAPLDCMTQGLGGVGGKAEHHGKASFSFLVQLLEDVQSAKS